MRAQCEPLVIATERGFVGYGDNGRQVFVRNYENAEPYFSELQAHTAAKNIAGLRVYWILKVVDRVVLTKRR